MEIKETEVLPKKGGDRFNEGKLRYDLIEPYALEQLVKVFTLGAKKYAPRNWEKGMSWTSVLASLKRHTAEFEKGIDFDEETGLYHAIHAAWNAMALVSYYKIAPQFDDRAHKYLKHPKIGLDIDEVLCDWVGGYMELRGMDKRPTAWLFDRELGEVFKQMDEAGTRDDFMLSLKPLIKPEDIPFEPHCYITARHVPNEITMKWLDMNGFPTAPVYTVGPNTTKVEVAKASGIDIFVDDNFKNFVELNNAGICTYLYDQPHNHRYDVGHKRIYNLKQLV